MQFNARETASVLVGLRMLQLAQDDNAIPGCFNDHFEDEAPLTDEEIDDLCERINCDPAAQETTPILDLEYRVLWSETIGGLRMRFSGKVSRNFAEKQTEAASRCKAHNCYDVTVEAREASHLPWPRFWDGRDSLEAEHAHSIEEAPGRWEPSGEMRGNA